jgi:hypothetical protein
LKEIQKVMVGRGLQADNLGWSSSASNRIGRRDIRRKRYKARAWKAPATTFCTMEVVLGGSRPSHHTGVGGRLERDEGVTTQALR